jgi:hypothetical protein
MDKSISRIIGKAGFLIIIIGFLMPIIFNQNGFQITKYLSEYFSNNAETFSGLTGEENEKTVEAENFLLFKNGKYTVNISLYGIFIISCIGVLFFILLLIKNKINILYIFDWIIIILAFIAMLAIFSGITNVIRYIPNEENLFGITGVGKRVGSIGEIFFSLLKHGTYFILFGLIISLIFNVISSFTRKENEKNVYDIKTILIILFLIFSVVFGCFLAIITG